MTSRQAARLAGIDLGRGGKSGHNLGRDHYRALQTWAAARAAPRRRVERKPTAHTRPRGRDRYEKGTPEALRLRAVRRSVRRRARREARAEWDRNLRESHAHRKAEHAR